jgi:hypothetical protein
LAPLELAHGLPNGKPILTAGPEKCKRRQFMSTYHAKTSCKRLAAISLAGLLLVAQPAWAATKSTKRSSKAQVTNAVSASETSTASTYGASTGCKLGTAIDWMQSPDDASKAAADQDKLVFMIQVSGNFARQEFT